MLDGGLHLDAPGGEGLMPLELVVVVHGLGKKKGPRRVWFESYG